MRFRQMFLCSVMIAFCRLAAAAQGPDLSAAYTDGLADAAPGATLVYTLTITNNSNFDATNASATCTVPAALSFTSSANGVFANGTVTFSNLTVPANGTLLLQFNAAVINPLPAGTPHSFSSTATVSVDPAQGVDPNLNNNSATDTDTLDLAPDPVICSVTDGVACSNANGVLTYVIDACNIGNIGVTGVVVTDTIPIGTTFVSADNGGTFANGVVTWPAYTIPGGIHTTRSVTVTVNSPIPNGVTNLVDTVNITDDGTNGADANPNNNTLSDTDCIMPSAFLVIAKTVDIPNPNIADTVTYTVVVTNDGPGGASNVTVTDVLPAGLTLVSAMQTLGVYDTTNGLWTIGALANGQAATLTISATVNAGAPSQIDNTACVSNTPEINSNAANGCSTVTITPSCAKKPLILSGPNASPPIAVSGVPETFSVTTSNNGSGVAVVVTWDFGDGTTGSGATVEHTYAAGGTFTVKAVATNACGGVGASVSLDQFVVGTPNPFDCSILHSQLNFAKANADNLTLLAEVTLPAKFSLAGQMVVVQINNFKFSAVVDSHGRYKDATHNLSLKPLGAGTLLALKISHASLSGSLVPGVTPGTKSETFTGTPFLIQVGSQSYGVSVSTHYLAKKNTAIYSR